MNSMVEENIEGNRVVKAIRARTVETEKLRQTQRRLHATQHGPGLQQPQIHAMARRSRLLTAADHAWIRRIPGHHRAHDPRQSRGVQLLPVDDRRAGTPIRMADQRLAAIQRILHQNPQTAHRSVTYYGKAGKYGKTGRQRRRESRQHSGRNRCNNQHNPHRRQHRLPACQLRLPRRTGHPRA